MTASDYFNPDHPLPSIPVLSLSSAIKWDELPTRADLAAENARLRIEIQHIQAKQLDHFLYAVLFCLICSLVTAYFVDGLSVSYYKIKLHRNDFQAPVVEELCPADTIDTGTSCVPISKTV